MPEVLQSADPFFEGGGIFLTYNDFLIEGKDQFYGDFTLLQGLIAFDKIDVDDEFPVGPVKLLTVELLV